MNRRPHEIFPERAPGFHAPEDDDAAPFWLFCTGLVVVGMLCALLLVAIGYMLGSALQTKPAGSGETPGRPQSISAAFGSHTSRNHDRQGRHQNGV